MKLCLLLAAIFPLSSFASNSHVIVMPRQDDPKWHAYCSAVADQARLAGIEALARHKEIS